MRMDKTSGCESGRKSNCGEGKKEHGIRRMMFDLLRTCEYIGAYQEARVNHSLLTIPRVRGTHHTKDLYFVFQLRISVL